MKDRSCNVPGWLCVTALLLLCGRCIPAQDMTAQHLNGLTLEDLMNIRVTSIAKKEQAVSETVAAVYVITREDIRRSGMTNIPDLLRMAPGLNVTRITPTRGP